MKITLKEFFMQLLRDQRIYLETKIAAVDDKYAAAVMAIRELSAQTFTASEKAILKSEESQKELNVKNNEFRAQLKDQADVLMPRAEFQSMHRNLEDKLGTMKNEFERQFETTRKEIQSLRESRSTVEGKTIGVRDFRDFAGWGVAILVGLLALAQYLGK